MADTIPEGDILTRRAKKVVRWGSGGMGVLVTAEIRALKWSPNTILRAMVVKHRDGKKRIVLEELGTV